MNIFLILVSAALPGIPLIIFEMRTKKKKNERREFTDEDYRFQNVVLEVKRLISEKIRNKTGSELSLEHIQKAEIRKARLRNAVREACFGDFGDREFLKEHIKDILQNDLNVNEETIEKIIPFNEPEKMNDGDVFEYMYAIYRRIFGIHIIRNMFGDFGWDAQDCTRGNESGYEINGNMVRNAFGACLYETCFADKLEMLAQRCYEILYGHDRADILIMDTDIDGVSGGTGGRTRNEFNYLEELFGPEKKKGPEMWDTIYCVYRGRLIRMSCLSFEKQEVLERVVRNIYRYNSRNSLSKQNPVLHSSMKNNSRVVVTRPPVSDGWSFFVRKFTSSDARNIESLITDEENGMVISLLKMIVEAELNFVVSGNTGGGKTTLVKALIEYINPSYALRVVESTFELNINNLYPGRNVHVMQERGDFTIYDAITASKKMDTDVLILGEVNEPKVAGAFIQVAQSGSRMAITTLHHETTRKLIEYMRNALVSECGLNDPKIAQKQVTDCINFDIHIVHDVTGHHYIERITQIVPEGESYYLQNIIEFDKEAGAYIKISDVMGKAAQLIGKEWYES